MDEVLFSRVDFDAVEQEPVDHEGCGMIIFLIPGNDPAVGGLVLILINHITGHTPFIEEELVFVFRPHLQNRLGGGQVVGDGVSQTPPSSLPGIGIEDTLGQIPVARGKVIECIVVGCGIAVVGRLCKDGWNVVNLGVENSPFNVLSKTFSSGFGPNEGISWSIPIVTGHEYSYYVSCETNVIPEPTTILLFAFGGLMLRKRRA